MGAGLGLHLEPIFGLRREDCECGDDAYIERGELAPDPSNLALGRP